MTKKIAICAVGAGLAYSAIGMAADKAVAGDPSTTARYIAYHENDIPAISTQYRYSTLILLPRGERIVAAVCGDKDYWDVAATNDGGLVTVKPSKTGVRTDLIIAAASGNIYTFTLKEISDVSGASADLRIQVTAADAKMIQTAKAEPLFVSVAEKNEAEKRAAEAERNAIAAQQVADAKIAKIKETARERAEAGIKHTYKWDHDSKAAKLLNIQDMYESAGFTVVEANPQETAELYEKKDKHDSLIEWHFENGKYTATKLVNDGYLKIGKTKLEFHRES